MLNSDRVMEVVSEAARLLLEVLTKRCGVHNALPASSNALMYSTMHPENNLIPSRIDDQTTPNKAPSLILLFLNSKIDLLCHTELFAQCGLVFSRQSRIALSGQLLSVNCGTVSVRHNIRWAQVLINSHQMRKLSSVFQVIKC
jgi:hypothetical protein